PTEGLQFTLYHVSKDDLAAKQGATAWTPSGAPVKVDALGVAPPGWSEYPAQLRWTAGLRVPRYWNYQFEVGPGPAKLTIDGYEVVAVPPGAASQAGVVALARGDHAVTYEGTLASPGQPARLRWGEMTEAGAPGPMRTPERQELFADASEPHGLLGVI